MHARTVGSVIPVRTSLNHPSAASSSQFYRSSPFLANRVRKTDLGMGGKVAVTTSSTPFGSVIPHSSAGCTVISSGSAVSNCSSDSSVLTESQNSANSTTSDLSGPTISSSTEGKFLHTDGMVVTSVTDVKTLDAGENLDSYSAGVEVLAPGSFDVVAESQKSLQSVHTTTSSVMSSSAATETKVYEVRRVTVAPFESKLTPVQRSLISLARSSSVEEPKVRKRSKSTNTCTAPSDKTVKRKVLFGSDGQSLSLCTQASSTASPVLQFNDSLNKRVTAGVSVDEEKRTRIDSKVGCSSTVSLPLPYQSSVASTCNVDQQRQLENGKRKAAGCWNWTSWARDYVNSALKSRPPDLSVFPPTNLSLQSEQHLSKKQKNKMCKAVRQVLAEAGADDLLPSFLQSLSSQSCTVTGNSEARHSTPGKRRRLTEKGRKKSGGISNHVKPSFHPGVNFQFQFSPKAKKPSVKVASGKKMATERIIGKKSKQSSGISNDIKPTVEPCGQYSPQVEVLSTELFSSQEMGKTAFSLAKVSTYLSDEDKQIDSYISTSSAAAADCGNSGNSNDVKPSEQPCGKFQFPPQVQVSTAELASSKEVVCGKMALSPATVASQIRLSSTCSVVTTTDDDIQPCFKYPFPPQLQVPGNSQNIVATSISVSEVGDRPVPRESLPVAAATAVGFTPIVCSERDVRSRSGIQAEDHQAARTSSDHVLNLVDCKASGALVASCTMSDVNNNDVCDADDMRAASVVDLTVDETDYIVIDSDGYDDKSTSEVSPFVPELLLSFTEDIASASPTVLTTDSEVGMTAERSGTDSDEDVITSSVIVIDVSAAATSVNDLTDLVLPDSSTSPDSDKSCYVPMSTVKRNNVNSRKPSATSSSVVPLVVQIPTSGKRKVTVSQQIATLPPRHVNGRPAATVTASINSSHCQTATSTTCASRQTVPAVPRIAGAGRQERKRNHSKVELSALETETIVISDDDDEDFVIVDEVSSVEANITGVESSESNQCKISYLLTSVSVVVQ